MGHIPEYTIVINDELDEFVHMVAEAASVTPEDILHDILFYLL